MSEYSKNILCEKHLNFRGDGCLACLYDNWKKAEKERDALKVEVEELRGIKIEKEEGLTIGAIVDVIKDNHRLKAHVRELEALGCKVEEEKWDIRIERDELREALVDLLNSEYAEAHNKALYMQRLLRKWVKEDSHE